MLLSVQLYSVREQIQSLGIEEVLKTVADSGFDAVETAGDYGLGVAGLKRKLDEANLKCTGMHVSEDDIRNIVRTAESAKLLGCRDIILAYLPPEKLEDGIAETARLLNTAGTDLPSGYRLCYHNHESEFRSGNGLIRLRDAVPSLYFELDAFWIKSAGLDVTFLAQQLREKTASFHLKEMGPGGKDDFNPVIGGGVSDSCEIIRTAVNLGHGYIVLEAEKLAMPYGEYLKRSAAFIKKCLA